jgi:hypothetical protein
MIKRREGYPFLIHLMGEGDEGDVPILHYHECGGYRLQDYAGDGFL